MSIQWQQFVIANYYTSLFEFIQYYILSSCFLFLLLNKLNALTKLNNTLAVI